MLPYSRTQGNYYIAQGIVYNMRSPLTLDFAGNLFMYINTHHFQETGPANIQGKTGQIAALSITMLTISLVLYRSYSNHGRLERTWQRKHVKAVSGSVRPSVHLDENAAKAWGKRPKRTSTREVGTIVKQGDIIGST
ncbi:hypothetical protein BCON_0028g00390 [Botryotinia convoluta]|uniref:Uncharacterized protein n=1 Tax=Botryotinia convoluta TaxID=54673 RepID=A0A4Z1IPF2_9HELO|nr:hypothetical protein BCON_0028g00390 [Botryotinia convoluta]